MTTYSPTRHALPMGQTPVAQTAGQRGLSAMLLAAMVSALIVVADQLIETWADGHLMLAWVALWVIAFAALALFAGSAQRLAQATLEALNGWAARSAQARADRRLWASAQADPRIMADLQAAMDRSNAA
ncbi:MAG: hypothetical protein KA173_00140 [Rhodoferax sp.]|nr:hypothetical protein [Rhodoferax sp.]MBP7491737.1 hypothetical protein [Rhodoferax sp.]